MDQRLSLVTLGVTDLDRARTFYRALGWTPGPSPEHIAFFQAGAMVIGLWERAALAVDSAIDVSDDTDQTPGSGDRPLRHLPTTGDQLASSGSSSGHRRSIDMSTQC